MSFPKIGSFRDVDAFRRHLEAVVGEAPVDDGVVAGAASPLAQDAVLADGVDGAGGADGARSLRIGNRWAIHPMEGWDGETDGTPSALTERRWQHFGESGAKLIWGGEAVAVRFDARANPNQLVIAEKTLAGLAALRSALIEAHRARWGGVDGLVIGLQLTHSGRFSKPHRKDRFEPRVAYRHPILDRRFSVTSDAQVLTDAEVEGLIGDFVRAAKQAREIGFDFVDLKHCHGYLLHEFLGAHVRPGRYGGSFENRTRILRELSAGIRREAPGLAIGVRASIFDRIPFRPDPARSDGRKLGPGIPEDFAALLPYRWGFGVREDDPREPSLEEGARLLGLLRDLGIRLVNISAGSPYYNPHIQRPAYYPPSDGYAPPEDPLAGVFHQLRAARELKRRFPELLLVGSAFSYLQDFLPQVAQAVVREGWMDFAGLGRMVLSYWDLPGDCLEGRPLDKKRFCRTFSDCTTAPRNGLVSGCFPLDRFYAERPEAEALKRIKAERA
jgi:2,4-dienoyl-CoA reductase-like NADH-dependent reductase (Old Yellow Enzyme family)